MLRFVVRTIAMVASVLWTVAMAAVVLALLEGGSLLDTIDVGTGDPELDQAIGNGLLMVERAGIAGAAVAWVVGLIAIGIARALLLGLLALLGAAVANAPAPSRPATRRAPTPPAPEPAASLPGPWERVRPARARDVRPPADDGTPAPTTRPARSMPTRPGAGVVERQTRLGRLFGDEAGVVIQRPRGHVVER
ncbi:MAG: hypothetical protein AB7O45_05200 [Alphaproteobacteria bacterium]